MHYFYVLHRSCVLDTENGVIHSAAANSYCLKLHNCFCSKDTWMTHLVMINNHLFQSDLSASTSELLSVIGGEALQEQELEAGDLMSFAQQIASGMVSEEIFLILTELAKDPQLSMKHKFSAWRRPAGCSRLTTFTSLSLVHIPICTICRSTWLDCQWCTET